MTTLAAELVALRGKLDPEAIESMKKLYTVSLLYAPNPDGTYSDEAIRAAAATPLTETMQGMVDAFTANLLRAIQ